MNHRENLESLDLEGQVNRLRDLIQSEQNVSSHALGTLLALEMSLEIKNEIVPGSKTGHIVVEWVKIYGQELVDEAVLYAREFLVNPNKLKKGLENRLFLKEDQS
jgi:hypothetical protein